MNIAVRYVSRTGNTEKVARSIAGALGVEAVSIDGPAAGLEGETELLFLGAAVYAFGIDDKAAAFIQGLDKAAVKKVALFSTSALVKSAPLLAAPSLIKKLLSEKGIPLSDRAFHCWGEFKFMRKGRPNAEDLERARVFAKETALIPGA
jgi:flavodoxin